MKEVRISKDCEKIKASYDDYSEFILDVNGYLLIRVNYKQELLEVGLVKKDNVIIKLISGKTPLTVYKTAINHHFVSRKDHAAYLGRELQKAYTCLKRGLLYVQDSEIDFSKKAFKDFS